MKTSKTHKTHHWRDRDSEFSLPLITIVVEKGGTCIQPLPSGTGIEMLAVGLATSPSGHHVQLLGMEACTTVRVSPTQQLTCSGPQWDGRHGHFDGQNHGRCWYSMIQHEIDGHYTPLYFRDTPVWDELTCFYSLVAIFCWSCCPARHLLPT